MKFYFPDSQDLVDPSFDFETEKRSETRIRQRDDRYAHEVFKKPPYDGMLVSKAIVEGTGLSTGRYTMGQQRRFAVQGVKEFLRMPLGMEVIGDCGAFTYVKEPVPPVTVDDVIRFYDDAGFDYGASIDHIVLEYNAQWDHKRERGNIPQKCIERQELTFELAREFIKRCKNDRVCFEPLGIAQGWSPKSYASAVSKLQKMGFQYIALGGLVPLKSEEILEVLEEVYPRLKLQSQLHLFGVTRLSHAKEFAKYGVVSFDSTSPLTQAFKEDRNNYYQRFEKKGDKEYEPRYTAIRVPQVDVNVKLKNRILSGEVRQGEAFRLERECLDALALFGKRRFKREELIQLLNEYQSLFGGMRNYSAEYEQTLRDRPWESCDCEVCKELGINVVIFRGAERNRRRGFHNVYVTHKKLHRMRRSFVRQ